MTIESSSVAFIVDITSLKYNNKCDDFCPTKKCSTKMVKLQSFL